ncbi:TonB-dependent receptor [Pelomonas sp. SE-A7]|uniref:TonB-dependent receptor n=1 Tax=Pelomonas sp. SE-A7 TaxID=3054953 RepID=UPI00259CF2C9|nr:TonB-dependent receptor [Pelomonas sp. SE-A7]MDM4768157.1 TonB-dependent receptor [Pelomonas sp. SE-A7]
MIPSFKPTPVAQAITLALMMAGSTLALAQSAPASSDAEAKKAAEAKKQLETVQVTGIRASTEQSLLMKKDAGANIDVITALDVGKMPDKNLADSLQRVVGVAVRTDYDEAEKVAMRGTNPDMSLILFNGHTVSGGDWYLADQSSSSRSTSLSLMPSSVLNAATVYKTSQANIVDGGLAGTINVTTRKPLDQKKSLGGVVSVGGVYADLPGKTGPQLNASVNWKNEANNFGVIAQAFGEKRYVRRDSVSRLAYGANSGWDQINLSTMLGITDASLAGTGYKAADLQDVRMPGSMATEFVEGVRDRKGGMFAVQARPTNDWDVGVTGFYSTMGASNFGRATMGAMNSMLRGLAGTTGETTVFTNSNGQRVYAQIKNPVIVTEKTIYGDTLRVLKSADIVFPDGTTPQYMGNSEGFYRSGAKASSGFLDFDAKWQASKDLVFKGLFSTTRGVGHTENDRGLTYARFGKGVSYAFNDVDEAPNFKTIGGGDGSTPALNADGSGYRLVSRSGINRYHTVDREKSVAIDGELTQDFDIFTSLQFGVRRADHNRDFRRSIVALKAPFSAATGTPPVSAAVSYPGDFGNGLGGTFENTGFYFPKEYLVDYFANVAKTTTPEFERFVSSEIELREVQTSLYAMQNFEAKNGLSGNIGIRFVRTMVNSMTPVPIPAGACARIEPGKPVTPCATFPDAINTAGDAVSYYDGVAWNPAAGTMYYKKANKRNFDNFLPSLNLRWEIDRTLIARLGASKTIGRQNYNLYGANFTGATCTSAGCQVTGPNPDLTPLTARNLDLSLAWYFARRAMLSVSAFGSLINGYAKTGAVQSGASVDLYDSSTNSFRTYQINTSTQQKAKIRGVEIAYEQPIGAGFGFTSNVSLAETSVEDGRPMNGASKVAWNLGGYYEDDAFSARLVFNYRGRYVSSTTAPAPTANSQGLSTIGGVLMPTAPTIAAPVTNVALSMNYNLTKELQLSFNATNLTNPGRAQYRYSEAEQQKLDVSGRQYYLEARYKF